MRSRRVHECVAQRRALRPMEMVARRGLFWRDSCITGSTYGGIRTRPKRCLGTGATSSRSRRNGGKTGEGGSRNGGLGRGMSVRPSRGSLRSGSGNRDPGAADHHLDRHGDQD